MAKKENKDSAYNMLDDISSPCRIPTTDDLLQKRIAFVYKHYCHALAADHAREVDEWNARQQAGADAYNEELKNKQGAKE